MKRTLPFLLASVVAGVVSAQSPAGLDALSDDRLLNELASRRLTSLLERAFDVNNTPKEKREGVTTLIALQQLSDPAERLSNKQRSELIGKVVRGIEQALPSLTDGTTLMQQAKTIIAAGTERPRNTLEYWGPNPVTMAELKPIAQVVSKIYAKASAEYKKQEEKLSNQVSNPNDPRLAEIDKLANLAILAEFSQKMSDYTLALSMDPKNPNEAAARSQLITEALTYLKQWDTPDSQIQPTVKIAMAKYNMLKSDFAEAKKLFDQIINDKGEIKPPPTSFEQYEARYFNTQSEVLAGNLDVAQKEISQLESWEKANLPKDDSVQKGVAAALSMLQFRLHSKAAEIAKNDADKNKANDAAIAVLTQLRKDRPDLISIIDEQLMTRLPANPDMTKLDALLLGALITKADAETKLPEGQQPDKTVLERGVAAAKEYISRKGKPGIEAKFIDDAAIRLPIFLMKLGRNMEAANAFMDYMKDYGATNLDNAKFAMENAAALIMAARKTDITDEAASKAYDRFLPMAINKPFNRLELAYAYAARSQQLGDYKNAIIFFKLVPKTDPNYAMARYRLMVALKAKLDAEGKKLPAAERDGVLREIQSVADEVKSSAEAGLASAKDDATKKNFQGMLVRTSLLAADLSSRSQNDPKRTLQLLSDFETRAKGLPNEDDLVPEALLLTVNAHMALGQTGRATDALVELLNRRPGGQGAQIVYNLLMKLNEQYDKAKKEGDKAALKRLADDRAQLSGFLVKWARDNSNPEIKAQTYNYQRFDAVTKHDAAMLESDPKKREEGLKTALTLFEALKSKENIAAFKAATKNAGESDPQVDFQLAMIHFDLGNFKAASDLLHQLRKEGKLGRPLRTDIQNGQEVLVDNDQYWEATYKELKSMLEMNNAGTGDKDNFVEGQRFLKRLYVERGDKVGGSLWHDEFESLRKEMVPDFDPSKLLTPEGTTQPVAGER